MPPRPAKIAKAKAGSDAAASLAAATRAAKNASFWEQYSTGLLYAWLADFRGATLPFSKVEDREYILAQIALHNLTRPKGNKVKKLEQLQAVWKRRVGGDGDPLGLKSPATSSAASSAADSGVLDPGDDGEDGDDDDEDSDEKPDTPLVLTCLCCGWENPHKAGPVRCEGPNCGLRADLPPSHEHNLRIAKIQDAAIAQGSEASISSSSKPESVAQYFKS